MLSVPFRDLNAYLSCFAAQPIPVLRRTARRLAELQASEDSVSVRQIASVVAEDPLMALRLLVFLSNNRGRSQNHDLTTVDRAVMMMGIGPFFREFGDLLAVEVHLAAHPKALVGLLRVINRAKHAARYARDWAVIRHDIDVDEISMAALLHEAAETLLWCVGPELMLKVAQLLQDTPGLRSVQAQQAVLNIAIRDIQLALARAWHLPELLVHLMEEARAEHPRVRNVLLACNMARHAANGWDDPALPDDYAALTDLLRVPLEPLLLRMGVPQAHWPAPTAPAP